MSFLSEVNSKYATNYEDKLFLLPTRRSVGLFKGKWIDPNSQKATLLPNATTWSDYVDSITPFRTLSGTESLVHLYACLLELQPGAIDYKRFLSWASTVLSDFESIVLQKLKGEDVFQKAFLLQSINQWNLNPETVKSYMEFWELLPKLYKHFYSRLAQLKLQTRAMAFQNAWNTREVWSTKMKESEIVLLGFTVFSPFEILLLRALENKFKIQVIYDSPLFEGVEENHESNRFLAVLQREFQHLQVVSSGSASKQMESIECANSYSMVKKLSQILSDISTEGLNSTAVVLLNDADAPLLLNSIPKNVTEFNLGIGKPYNQTDQGSLFGLILECWKTLNTNGHVPFQLVESLIRRLTRVLPLYRADSEAYLSRLVKNNVSLLNAERLHSILVELDQVDLGNALIQSRFSEFINLLSKNHNIDFTIFDEVKSSINRIMINAQIDLPEVYEYLFINELYSLNQSIKGNPKKGLQILSLLESRVLDFDHLIFLSFNDSNLPGTGSFSYIPFELQIQFGLPDPSAKEAVIAYHYMRILKRAKTAKYLYSSKESGLSSGESSRYNLQAQWEWSKNSTEVQYSQKSLLTSIKAFKNDIYALPKHGEIVEQTKKYLFERGLSPSALNVYLSNPLDFFLMQVMGLREKDKVDSNIASFNLGEIIHGTLEDSYKEYQNVQLNKNTFENIRQQLDFRIQNQIENLFRTQLKQNAKLKILNPVVHRWINQFFEFELRRLRKEEFKVIEVERSLKIKVLNKQFPILLKGIVDRVDESPDGTRHVIDYKTGKVEPKDLKLESEELVQLNPDKTKAYQLLLYAYAYWLQYPTDKKIKCSIYSFRNQKSGLIPLLIDGNPWLDYKIFKQFDKGLGVIIEEMLDVHIPFEYRTEGYTKFEL